MTKKSKSTKQIRAIDRIIKFQIDDGIESLTISGKEALADVSIDSKANVTLYLNADKDKINDIQSLVPFVTVQTVTGGTETDKTKTVTLSQDLTQFALEIADNSKELASIIKAKSSIKLDLAGLVQKLLDIAGKLAELEEKNQEQDQRLTAIEAKNQEQDNKLATLETEQAEHASKLATLENNIHHTNENRFMVSNANISITTTHSLIGFELQAHISLDGYGTITISYPDGKTDHLILALPKNKMVTITQSKTYQVINNGLNYSIIVYGLNYENGQINVFGTNFKNTPDTETSFNITQILRKEL